MKKLIIITVITLTSLLSMAQTKEKYCMIYKQMDQKNKIKVMLDDGEGKPDYIQDKLTGDPILFDSMIHALHYMIDLGWQLVTMTSTEKESVINHHYLLKK